MSKQFIENTRLKIEDDIITSEMDDQLKKNALDFIEHMKANGMARDTGDYPDFSFAGGYVCQVHIYPVDNISGWTIFMGSYDSVLCRKEYQDYPVDQEMKAFAWANINHCGNCPCGTQPGKRIMLFGKEINNLCSAILMFRNPDGETLDSVKRLTVVWAQSNAHAAKHDIPYVPGADEWSSAKGFGAHASRALGKVYTKSLDVRFYLTLRLRYARAAFGFSGGGWVPTAPEQIPAALDMGGNGGHSARFQANKEPAKGWASVETLKYQAHVTYFAEMSLNITDGTYSVTLWMLDANGDIDTPYCIAKDAPFRCGGDPAIPVITTIDTMYLASSTKDEAIVRDFKVVGGE